MPRQYEDGKTAYGDIVGDRTTGELHFKGTSDCHMYYRHDIARS